MVRPEKHTSKSVRSRLMVLMFTSLLIALSAGDALAATATISGGPSSGNAPLTVSLSGSGSPSSNTGCPNPTYQWDFDDGPSKEGQSVSHTYKTPGTYTVTFTYTRYSGFFDPFNPGCKAEEASATKTIKVFALATPAKSLTVSASPTGGLAPLSVSFGASGSPRSDSGCQAATYAWDFGDGASSEGSTATAFHTYTRAGTFTATATYTFYIQGFPFCEAESTPIRCLAPIPST